MENSLDCSVMCTCRIAAVIGAGIGAEESCKTSSCRIAVLEVSVEDCNVTASNGAFLK